jgi:hypothetical protein
MRKCVYAFAVTEKYNGIPKQTDAIIENQRNVGNYASGYNALAIQSINCREATSVCKQREYGFMALSTFQLYLMQLTELEHKTKH